MAVIEGEWAETPALVPVRMLNEFVYCPRLFHLEWASQLFADNEYTVDGRWQHRAVEDAVGAAPSPIDDAPFKEARALQLSSERLGLVGKADIVETVDGKVIPVDVKRGRPATSGTKVRLPEQVQLCALGLLLREHGYECDEGAIFFVESRQRVPVVFDEDLIHTTMAALEELRVAAASSTPPPPLVDSPKCDGCSLVGICLPDEVAFLAARRAAAPRRLVPSDEAARPLYVMEPGSYLRKSGGRLEVTKDRAVLSSLRLIDVSQVAVFGNVQMSSQLVRELMAREIPVCWFSWGGWFQGITEGLPGKNVGLRRRQVLRAEESDVGIARAMIEGKIRNSRTLLRRNCRPADRDVLESFRKLAARASRAESVQTLLGHEGTAARMYFAQFPRMLRHAEALPGGTYHFAGRNRRPPLDAVNCLLSFAYGLLTKDVVATLRSIGFDPYLGFLHRPRFGRPALALDLAEEFRPLVAESCVLTAINNGEVRPHHFVVRAGGVALTAEGRRAFIGIYERRLASEVTHPTFEYKVTWRRALEVQARILAAVLFGEVDRYVPMTTR